MAIGQGDVFFRRIIDLVMEDIRKNPWLVDDILSDFITDPMLSTIYGQKEIENAKKWLKDNEISVFLPHRMDMEKLPCFTISIGSNSEDRALATMGDLTPFIETYEPSQVGKAIQYIIPPFSYTSYTQATGTFIVPSTVDLTVIQPGMVVVDPSIGVGYVVTEKVVNGFKIAENTVVTATQIGILPQYRIFKARRERATFQERITIGCHVHGDPNSLLWLYSFMMYGLLRYREGVLESRNFQISNLETSDMIRNPHFEGMGENVYSRFITISGQVENTWVKAPKRVIEAININNFEQDIDGIGTGLIILGPDGGEIPEIIDDKCENWAARTDEE
jgi:hypothetical protein